MRLRVVRIVNGGSLPPGMWGRLFLNKSLKRSVSRATGSALATGSRLVMTRSSLLRALTRTLVLPFLP
jgi:hypothetical protein